MKIMKITLYYGKILITNIYILIYNLFIYMTKLVNYI